MGDFQPEAQVKGWEGFNFMAWICNKISAVFLAVCLLKIISAKLLIFLLFAEVILLTNFFISDTIQGYFDIFSRIFVSQVMIKIFVNDKPIVLTTRIEEETNFKNYLLKSVKIGKVIKELNKTDIAEIRLIHQKEEKLLKKFLKLLPNVTAGGGKVINPKGETLFIIRNGKWDLPKGKVEKKESIPATALREVEEETGVKGLHITKPLDITYHIFKRNGRYKIKITYWFEMTTTYDGKLEPEESEGITGVAWLTPQQVTAALENSYANVKTLF